MIILLIISISSVYFGR